MANIFLLASLLIAVSLGSDYDPEQVHINWADEEDAMYVTWASQLPTSYPVVQYMPVGNRTQYVTEFRFEAYGAWRNFTNSPTKPGTRVLYSCTAKMGDLVQGEFYRYRVGSYEYGWSQQFVFQAKRKFEYPDTLAKFLVFGDLGTGPEIEATMAMLENEIEVESYDAILFLGDMAYDLDDDHGTNGDLFLNSIQPIASRIPFMIAQGNHESWQHDTQDHFKYRFMMPGNSSNFWYSFNTGVAHFLIWSGEFVIQNKTDLQEQLIEFMEQDLSSVNLAQTPWVIGLAHRPYYCSADYTIVGLGEEVPRERHNKDCLSQGYRVREAFEDILYRHRIDLGLHGHVHAYERIAPVYQNETVPSNYDDQHTHINAQAPVTIITGNPGQQESYAPVSKTPLPFSMAQSDEVGYGRLTVFNSTHLLFEQVRSADKEVLDYVWLIKEDSLVQESKGLYSLADI